MEIHRRDTDSNLPNIGTVTPEAVEAELVRITRNGDTVYEFGEEALAETTFIIVRSDRDFLDVGCSSQYEVDFLSDRLCYADGWRRRLFAPSLLQFRTSPDGARLVIGDYMNCSRQDFESKYAVAYVDSVSSRSVRI